VACGGTITAEEMNMDDPQMYVEKLRKLYDRRKIGVNREDITFDCEHFACCSKAAAEAKPKGRDLVKGAEAHVGEKYGCPIRLVVISLDTGGGCEKEFGECLSVRQKTIQSVKYCGANPQMKGTIETLWHLYGKGKPECDLLKRFAMTNSAKCSGKDKPTNSVPDELYKNCKDHGLAELCVLDPELIVTQGNKAKYLLDCRDIDEEEIRKYMPCSVWDDLYLRSWIYKQLKKYLKYWNNGTRDVPVLQAIHPSTRGGQWQLFETTILPIAAYVIRQQLPCLDDFFRKPH